VVVVVVGGGVAVVSCCVRFLLFLLWRVVASSCVQSVVVKVGRICWGVLQFVVAAGVAIIGRKGVRGSARA
jgi:hypothetical protein